MQGWIWLALVSLLFGAAAFCVRERVRYQNYLAGQPFRDWIIERAPRVLNDVEATSKEKFGTLLMLQWIATSFHGVNLRSAAIGSRAKQSFVLEGLGSHAELITTGVRHLAVLAVLHDTWKGFGFRSLASKASDHPITFATKLMDSAVQNGSKGEYENISWTEETTEGVSHFPYARLFKQQFENRIVNEASG